MHKQKNQDRSFECDFLYIGDGFDNTVKTFGSETGWFLGSFVASGNNGLNGPRGLIFDHEGNLLVTNQKVNEGSGNVLKYDGKTGEFLGEIVKSDATGAPFAPRGIVLSKHNILFVADLVIEENGQHGEVRMYKYNGNTATFMRNLTHPPSGEFFPRGVVIGPDGDLYVSIRNNPNTAEGQLGGSVVRYNSKTGAFGGVFISPFSDLNRPEGLVFGPDGNLYITSFRRDASDTDKILIFDGRKGKLLEKIDLDVVGQPRAFAQEILFGPDGKLFVPINGPSDPDTGAPAGPYTGSVRRYNVHHKTYDVFVPPAMSGGPLGMPWYLTFGNTDPATLAYQCDREESSDHHHHYPPHSPHDESSEESSS
ncbi:hypothetical protein ACQKNS_04165 [Peribacillus sp. NPDC094092]|uniref:Vgb family protein n=1 Tax=Peribacillus sp. NPDC094092 TaxID=3390611 RepID=UPI003D0062BC